MPLFLRQKIVAFFIRWIFKRTQKKLKNEWDKIRRSR